MTDHASDPDAPPLSQLPLGLLLGRLAGVMRARILARVPGAVGDIRIVGLLLSVQAAPGAAQARHAAYLGVDVNTMRRLIDAAETDGLLRRDPAPGDRRAHVLALTPDGAALAQAGADAVAQVEAELAARIGAQDLSALRDLAERLLGAAQTR